METKEIAKLITDNPELPICFFGNDDGMCSEYSTTWLPNVSASIDYPLSGHKFPPLDEERIYLAEQDRDDIIEQYCERKWYERDEPNLTDAQNKKLEEEADAFWEKLPREPQICIFATV